MRARAGFWAALTILSFALSWVFAGVVLYAHNFPANHPEWINRKSLLTSEVKGTTAAQLRTRNLYRADRLNLHEWFGDNQFLAARVFKPGSIAARIRLGKEGHLALIFNADSRGFSGVRISRNPRFPSLYFRAARGGRFLERRPFEPPPLSGAAHDVELKFGPAGVALRIDGAEAARFDERALPRQLAGLQGGFSPAAVERFRAEDAGGETVFDRDFAYRRGAWPLRAAGLLATLAASGGAAVLAGRRRAWAVLAWQAGLLAGLMGYHAFDYWYWSRQYPYDGYVPTTQVAAMRQRERVFETARREFFSIFDFIDAPPSSAEAFREFLALPPRRPRGAYDLQVIDRPGGDLRFAPDDAASVARLRASMRKDARVVLLLGSSQMEGFVADSWKDNLTSRLHAFLARRLPDPGRLVVVNASVNGIRLTEAFERYRDRLSALRPEAVAADFSNNDGDPALFEAALRRLTEFDARRGYATILVQEANHAGARALRQRPYFSANHETMARVARELGLRCVPLHAYLWRPDVYDSGLLWWDRANLTSYGQALAADVIGAAVAGALTRPPKLLK